MFHVFTFSFKKIVTQTIEDKAFPKWQTCSCNYSSHSGSFHFHSMSERHLLIFHLGLAIEYGKDHPDLMDTKVAYAEVVDACKQVESSMRNLVHFVVTFDSYCHINIYLAGGQIVAFVICYHC